jgi:hypothetical protein
MALEGQVFGVPIDADQIDLPAEIVLALRGPEAQTRRHGDAEAAEVPVDGESNAFRASK